MRPFTANPYPHIQPGGLLVQLDDITLRLGDSRLFAHTSWTIETGQHWAIIGPNGAGKSLLASALCRQFNLSSGQILFFFGTTPRSYAERGEIVRIGPEDQTSLTPDSYHQARWNSSEGDHSPTVADLLTGESIEFVSAYQVGPTRIPPAVYHQRRDRAVELLGIRHLLDRKVLHLSNGEGRKLLIARALMQAPRLLILDDPFGGLDAGSRAILSQAIDDLLTTAPPQLILLTARPEEVPRGITHLLGVDNCQIVARGERREVVENPAFRHLLASLCGEEGTQSGRTSRQTESLPFCSLEGDGRRAVPLSRNEGTKPGGDAPPHLPSPISHLPSCPPDGGERPVATSTASPSRAPFPLASRPADHRLLVEIQNTSITYGGVQVLRQVDWTVRQGERWALLGPNGAGKSTLLSLILGDNPQAYHNHIHLFGRRRGSGESIWEVKARIGWVAPELQRHYPRSTLCRHTVCSGFFDSIGLYKACTPAQRELAAQWLAALDISPLADRPFGSLSIGEQRLVLLARALVKDPDLLILDEPCQGLDLLHTRSIVDLLERLCAQAPVTLIYVTHHPEELPQAITHLLRLDQGRVQERGRRADLLGSSGSSVTTCFIEPGANQ